MIFTSIPSNYASLTTPLIYRFDLEEMRDVVDVKIVDVIHNRTLGVRRLYDVQSAEVDIAPSLKRCFDLKPVDGGIAVVDAEGFYLVIAVEVDGLQSAERVFSPYPIQVGEGTIFRSGSKQQTISRGQSDYIVIYAPNGGLVSCEAYIGESVTTRLDMVVEAMPGLQILKIEPNTLDIFTDLIIVSVNIDGIEDFLTYRIVEKPEMAKRLMWCAADGTIQFYTFPTCRARKTHIEKQRVDTEQGLKIASCDAESVLSLISDYETVAQMERLGEILEAEYVWLDCGTDSVRVDVVSTESVVRFGGALNSLQVDIRAYNRKEDKL